MAIQSQYIRGAGEQVFEAGESGAMIAGPKFTSPTLDRDVSSHGVQDIAPTLQISVAVI